MSQFKYVGEFDEVIVPQVGAVKQGESAEFPDELAAQVSTDWEAVLTAEKKATTTSEETA